MTKQALVKPIRLALYALTGVGIAGAVLIGYAAWAQATLADGVAAFQAALTAEDIGELNVRLVDPAKIASGPEQNLSQLVILGGASLAIALVAIAVVLGHLWSRVVITLSGIATAFFALLLAVSDRDVALTYLFSRSAEPLSPGAMAAYNAILPPGFGTLTYLAELVIAGCLGWAIVVLYFPSAREFLVRRRERPDRVWTITPRT